ncbi:MAG: cryptochrome/photolyase family protein, partial [Planctomycetia bacterium]
MADAASRLKTRRLVLVLGDQLDADSAAFDDFDPRVDRVWMVEAADESTVVWSHKVRIAMFLSAMRHFRDDLTARGRPVDYHALDDPATKPSFGAQLAESVRRRRPERLVVVEPGEWRVAEELKRAAKTAGVALEVRADRHFYCSTEEFADHARGRKGLRMEYFYREMRRKTGVLMDDGAPVGGEWNFDKENRGGFPAKGPGKLTLPKSFAADAVTAGVLRLVADRFRDHPGSLADFDYPTTPTDAKAALDDFVEHRLPSFGKYQDAMWTDKPWLYHARLSAAMNLKFLDPRVVVDATAQAYRDGRAPLAAVEGFVRQILGWREYVRGVYWKFMPDYLERNALHA